MKEVKESMTQQYRHAKHTMLLVQYTQNSNSRTYLDFESVNGAMDGVIKMYEHKLKEMNPNRPKITYDIEDLFRYLDSLTDCNALVWNPENGNYTPYGREWIKKKVFQVLKHAAHYCCINVVSAMFYCIALTSTLRETARWIRFPIILGTFMLLGILRFEIQVSNVKPIGSLVVMMSSNVIVFINGSMTESCDCNLSYSLPESTNHESFSTTPLSSSFNLLNATLCITWLSPCASYTSRSGSPACLFAFDALIIQEFVRLFYLVLMFMRFKHVLPKRRENKCPVFPMVSSFALTMKYYETIFFEVSVSPRLITLPIKVLLYNNLNEFITFYPSIAPSRGRVDNYTQTIDTLWYRLPHGNLE